MELFYTTHARLRMRQRSIAKYQVEAAIGLPDRTQYSLSGRMIVLKTFDGRTLEVVYKLVRYRAVTITAYWR